MHVSLDCRSASLEGHYSLIGIFNATYIHSVSQRHFLSFDGPACRLHRAPKQASRTTFRPCVLIPTLSRHQASTAQQVSSSFATQNSHLSLAMGNPKARRYSNPDDTIVVYVAFRGV